MTRCEPMFCTASPAPNGWTRCTDKQAVMLNRPLVGASLLAKYAKAPRKRYDRAYR